MSNPYAAYNANADKEKSGTYIEAGAFRVKVARAGGKNVKYENTRELLTKPHRRSIQTNTLPKDVQDALNAELAARSLVTSWDVDTNFGKRDDNGVSLPPEWANNKMHDPDDPSVIIDATPENIIRIFLRYNDLYLMVANWAGDPENYLNTDEIEASGKN